MANYLDQSGLSLVLKSLNDVWMSDSGILKYTKENKKTYPVLRSTKDNKLDSLYVDVEDIWSAIDSINETAAETYSFKDFVVGENTIQADKIGDALSLVGDDVITLTADVDNDKVTFTHSESGVEIDADKNIKTVGAGGSVSNALGGNGSFKIPVISVNKFGHVTSASESEVSITMPTNKTLSFGLDTTDKMSYDGINAKRVYFKGENNTKITVEATDSNEDGVDDVLTYKISAPYPTSFAWVNGTSAGPTGSLTVSNDADPVSLGAIPSATNEQSGVVTTGDQTFAGSKTFNDQVNFAKTDAAPFTVSSNTLVTNLNADLLDGHDSEYFAVKADVDKQFKDLEDEIDAKVTGLFEYKGTLDGGSEDTPAGTPTTANVGDVHYVKTAGWFSVATPESDTATNIYAEVGDMFICVKDSGDIEWNVVQGNWTATDGSSALTWGETTTLATIGGVNIDASLPAASFFTSVKAADGNSINGSGNTLEFTDDDVVNVTVSSDKLNISHAKVGANKTVGESSAKTPEFGETFKVTTTTIDEYGHVTAADEYNVTIPSTEATTSVKGLMTTTQVTKLNGVADNATSDSKLEEDEISAAFLSGMGLTISVESEPESVS